MSVKQDEPMKFNAAIFEWYAMGYRYPILKVIEASIKKGERKVLDQSFAYLFMSVEEIGVLHASFFFTLHPSPFGSECR